MGLPMYYDTWDILFKSHSEIQNLRASGTIYNVYQFFFCLFAIVIRYCVVNSKIIVVGAALVRA